MEYTLSKLYKLFLLHNICIDSRKINGSEMFLALKGKNFDGNKFAAQAISKGCSYAIVDEPKVCLNNKYILVDNCLQTLQNLANLHRKKLNIPIVALTGSNGKTTTKELIRKVLSRRFITFATTGNLNNHIGVPLTLLSLPDSTEFAIVEMGANHIGEIATLCKIIEPNFGIITNVGLAHLEGFGSFNGVKKGKGELYNYIHQNRGILFVHKANKHLLSMLPKDVEIIFYGQSTLEEFTYEINPILTIKFNFGGRKYFVKTNLYGTYNVENILAAISMGLYFNIPMKDIKNALEEYIPENWRSQIKRTKKNTLILDNYNANPSSMTTSINNFATIKTTKKKVVILGDMLELGEYTKAEHQKIISLLKTKDFFNAFLVGKNFYEFSSQTDFFHFKYLHDLKKYLSRKNLKDHYILLKSSRSLQLEKIIECL